MRKDIDINDGERGGAKVFLGKVKENPGKSVVIVFLFVVAVVVLASM